MSKRFKFSIPIGDWSGDGHAQYEQFIASSNKTIEDVREAYFNAKIKYPDLCPENFCSDYDDSLIDQNIVSKLRKHGIRLNKDFKEEGLDIDDIVRILIWFINQGNPELDVRLEKNDIPMFPFYGKDKIGRHIGFIGYGLFRS